MNDVCTKGSDGVVSCWSRQDRDTAKMNAEERGLVLREDGLMEALKNTTDPAKIKDVMEELRHVSCSMFAKGGVFSPQESVQRWNDKYDGGQEWDGMIRQNLDTFESCAVEDQFKSNGYQEHCGALISWESTNKCNQKKMVKHVAVGTAMLASMAYLGAELTQLEVAVPAAAVTFTPAAAVFLGALGGYGLGKMIDVTVGLAMGTPLHEQWANGLFNFSQKHAPWINDIAAKLP